MHCLPDALAEPLSDALHIAAATYDETAGQLSSASKLSQQFIDLARQARNIAARIDKGEFYTKG